MNIEDPQDNQSNEGEVINDLAKELAPSDDVERERLVKRMNVLMAKHDNNIEKVEEEIRAEKNSPITADKHTATQGMLETTLEVPEDVKNEITVKTESLAKGDEDNMMQLSNRITKIYKLNGRDLEMAFKQIEDEIKNPEEKNIEFVN